ncbi:glycoside hydrolase family 128 protein [Apiospora saccharicola]
MARLFLLVRLSRPLFLALALGSSIATTAASNKRGLVFVPNEKWPQDSQIWIKPGTDLSWYYNYQPNPSPSYADTTQDKFEFIDGGRNISHVLGLNEPDGAISGGSNLDPKSAAQIWVKNMEPLAKRGVKLGMPAVTRSDRGVKWTKNFAQECAKALGVDGGNKNCTFDFLLLNSSCASVQDQHTEEVKRAHAMDIVFLLGWCCRNGVVPTSDEVPHATMPFVHTFISLLPLSKEHWVKAGYDLY